MRIELSCKIIKPAVKDKIDTNTMDPSVIATIILNVQFSFDFLSINLASGAIIKLKKNASENGIITLAAALDMFDSNELAKDLNCATPIIVIVIIDTVIKV